jgi:hypothetical protein
VQNNLQQFPASADQQRGICLCTVDRAAVAGGDPQTVQTTTDLYDWEVESCRLQFRPNLHCCYSMLEAFEQLQRDYPAWFVEFGPGCIRLFKNFGDADALLVLVEKGGAL